MGLSFPLSFGLGHPGEHEDQHVRLARRCWSGPSPRRAANERCWGCGAPVRRLGLLPGRGLTAAASSRALLAAQRGHTVRDIEIETPQFGLVFEVDTGVRTAHCAVKHAQVSQERLSHLELHLLGELAPKLSVRTPFLMEDQKPIEPLPKDVTRHRSCSMRPERTASRYASRTFPAEWG